MPVAARNETPATGWWNSPTPWPRWMAFVIFAVPTAISLFGLWLNYKPTRAHLAPVGASLEAQLVANQPMKVMLELENTGDDNAYDVVSVASPGMTLPVSAQEASIQQELGPLGGSAVDHCKDLQPRGGYPSIYRGKIGRLYLDQRSTFVASDDFIHGNKTFFVSGCTAYRSGWSEEMHTSEFCFFLSSHIDPKTGLRLFLPCRGNFNHT